MKGLLRRASTAVIFVVVMLGGLYGGYYSFVLLFAAITALCLWEFLEMTIDHGKKRDWLRRFLGTVFGLMPFLLAVLIHLKVIPMNDTFIIITALLFFPFIFMAFIYELIAQSDTPFSNVAFIVLGMVYIGAPFALLDFIAFEGDTFYANTIFGLLLMTWMNDSGAYIVGSKIGKTKLIPRISPNKTWEGSIGGVVVTYLTALVLSYFFPEKNIQDWFVLATIVAIFGSVGDLIESMLKRSVGVKDSGDLLPGHGGVLDRFDAFIFLLPFAAAYLLWVRG
jgi:phosphatidate cytidylyltransferase